MSFTKSHLKAARDHIDKKDYLNAKKEATQVLDFEPDNYNAHVFLGLSLLELGEFEESEQTYQKVTRQNPTQSLAWQGISRLYEKRQDWNKHADCLVKLMDLFNTSRDAVKCAESLQKLIVVRRNHGDQRQLIDSLSNYLHGSAFHTLLSTLPLPDPTNPASTTTFEAQVAIHNGSDVLDEIISLAEALEEDTCKREVEKRRMRLGAPNPDQLRKEVFRDVSNSSQLPDLYAAVLNHVNTSDELRRATESKLLRWKERRLYSLPHSLKLPLSQQLDEMVNGIVLLNTPDELGWKIFFEGHNCEDISGYDKDSVRKYIKLFPDSALASLFKGYFAYMNKSIADDEEELSLCVPTDDPVDILLNTYSNLSDTILGNRVIGKIYLEEEDYENAIKTSKLGLDALDRLELDFGKNLSKTRTGIQAVLATSLVHFYPPKHHKQAAAIIDQVLSCSPSNIPTLMGQAFVQQAALKWKDAGATFDLVISIIPDDINLGLRAREERAWCSVQIDLVEEGLSDLQQVLGALDGLGNNGGKRNSDRARCLWRIGKCHLLMRDAASAYSCFINSLKQDSEFAPSFTSLGIYYSDIFSPPDPIRASKCFQKAFELDARETVAARQLVEGFANDAEWGLVEVVAQRTIDGEGGVTGGLDKSELDPTNRYLPANSWAWKAIGVVKLHYGDYAAAIQSFQVALRVEPDDQNLWVHLGEAYNKAGRHVAALKALNYAHEMKPQDWICSFLIADVKHRMGLLEEAILVLKGLRDTRPTEAGILVCLAQSHLDLGRSQLSDSFQIRAEGSFVDAIKVALDIIEKVPGFRTMAWKVIADASFHLSTIYAFVDHETIRGTFQAICFLPPPDSVEKLVQIIPLPSFRTHEPLKALQIAAVAVHACLCQISLHLLHQTTDASAWYDLSIALQSWILKAPPNADKSTAKDLVIEYIKQALQANATNDTYWVVLGNALFVTHAKAAQHAYIKALEIDSKNSVTWVSLGLLYFYNGDLELANEAMYRAQALDPDNTSAWVGQFLIAVANGHEADAQSLLHHAVGLTNAVPEADYEFAFRVFKSTTNLQSATDFHDTLLPTFFLLNRYCRCRSIDESGLHLLALVCEKLGHLPFAETLVERALTILESVYEETEDPEVEKRYAIANATLGRLRLSQGDIAGSLISFESVLGLLSEKEDEPVDILKVQVHLGLGLAHFMQGDPESAIIFLEEGLLHAGEDLALRGQITIVLAQVIWSNGTGESKEIAKSRLLECITSDPENLAAINILAGMGILTDDDGLVDAALSEVMALPIDRKHKLDPHRDVNYLLIQHAVCQGDSKYALSIAQQAVSVEPSSIIQRNRLACLIVQSGVNAKEALALLNGMNDADISGQLEAAISALNIQTVPQKWNSDKGYNIDTLCKAQRAILRHPSDIRGWQTLAYVQAQIALKL